MSEWYDSAVGTAYLAMVMLISFGSLWLPCAWWWGFNDSVSLRLQALIKKWSNMMFTGSAGEAGKVEAKFVAMSGFISSPVWIVIGGILGSPDWWEPFLGGHEVCVGYFRYVMWVVLICWMASPGGWLTVACAVIAGYMISGFVLELGRFLWAGVKVLWKAIMDCKVNIRPYSVPAFFISLLILWEALAEWVIPTYFPEGFWFSLSSVSMGQLCLILLVSSVVLLSVSSLITYRFSSPEKKALFFFKVRGAEMLLGLTIKAGKMLWSKVSFIFESDSWFLGGAVSKVLRSSTDRQKKWALVLLLAVVIVSVGVGAGSYWAVSSGMALEQLWEAVMSDLFFG